MKVKDYFFEKILEIIDYARNRKETEESRRTIKKVFESHVIFDSFGKPISKKDVHIIRKSLLGYAASEPSEAANMAKRLADDEFEILNSSEDEFNGPILLCIIKDDLYRIKYIYDEYTKIGINKFVFIDNGSNDGTLEYLLSVGADVIRTKDRFISYAKSMWIYRTICHYGFDRWYLICDSDELIAYPGMEEHPVDDFLDFLNQNHIRASLSYMLDMYPDSNLLELNNNEAKMEDYKFFDSDSYKIIFGKHFPVITGGPRQRFIGEQSVTMYQQKYPFVYYERGDIYRYHYIYPYAKNSCKKCYCVLKHYKFTPGELNKFEKIIAEGNYAHGSMVYKELLKFINKSNVLSFYDKNSLEYRDSYDILNNPLVDNWKDELI